MILKNSDALAILAHGCITCAFYIVIIDGTVRTMDMAITITPRTNHGDKLPELDALSDTK
jgi:hypothetical protein